MVVGLIHPDFCKGNLTAEFTWKTVVLIPKGGGNFCGIRLVEFLWKTVTGIHFHDTLYNFLTDRVTRTISLKANMPQQLMAMREEFLYDIFLDLNKSYDALDRNLCLDILAAYVLGPQSLHLLRNYWNRLTMVDRAVGYFCTPLKMC